MRVSPRFEVDPKRRQESRLLGKLLLPQYILPPQSLIINFQPQENDTL